MRLSVRQQLSLLLLLSGCSGLAVLAIAVWITIHNFVINVSRMQLETAASVRAAQVSFNLEAMQVAGAFITTRYLLQQALQRYNNGSDTSASNWVSAQGDLEAALDNIGAIADPLVLQAKVFARNTNGPNRNSSVLNATGVGAGDVKLPWLNTNGSQAYLGSGDRGYPPSLYPNLTIYPDPSDHANDGSAQIYAGAYNGLQLGVQSTLVLGPLTINQTFSLLSLTLPVVNNDPSSSDILGWVTVVMDARLIQQVIQDPTGLGETGSTLLLGPVNTTNLFAPGVLGSNATADDLVRYLIPLNVSVTNRHPNHVYGTGNLPFQAGRYPAVEMAMERDLSRKGDAGSIMRTHDEAGLSVSVGYAIPPTTVVDWIVVVERARKDVWKPINDLRTTILACLFGVAGFLVFASFPIAHWFVRPIRRLKAATEQTIYTPADYRVASGSSGGDSVKGGLGATIRGSSMKVSQKEGIAWPLTKWRSRLQMDSSSENEPEPKPFRIPGKVRPRKVWIRDEMSDLVKTFNEMSDELLAQYTQLDDKVRERTNELEQSKRAAEAANESKTMFVANVSHELKTPLNGILGMSAVAMEEDDPKKLKSSLSIIYKSGDLLLRTLNDLLTFSSNQVGQLVLKLDEKEFAICDVETQVTSIFLDSARSRGVDLRVQFENGSGASGSPVLLREAFFWGDVHRILQIVINLTSNALKFTPQGGNVTVIMRYSPDLARTRGSFQAHRLSTTSDVRDSKALEPEVSGTANFIKLQPIATMPERTAAPPGKDLLVEFEVRDTGEGISEDMQHRIFEPFVQADAGLSRKHSGTGLGLSICSQLVTLMGGRIRLSSRVGQGSQFVVTLPLRYLPGRTATPRTSIDDSRANSRRSSSAPSNAGISKATSLHISRPAEPSSVATLGGAHDGVTASKAASVPDLSKAGASTTLHKQALASAAKDVHSKEEPKSDFSHVRVLVAEDNKVNQEVIMRMLKLEQIHDITIAEDAGAPSTSSGPGPRPPSPPTMPNMDGLAATKLIREHGFRRPIVALTAYAEQKNIDECLGCGMDYFLAKPIRRPQLKQVLTEYCSLSAGGGRQEAAAGGSAGMDGLS
ncbi:Two-component system protein B [Teratosphaeria destructans]|uniref:histidine kinase n=1 Tax=Teratosphaeria destructans TaxID=418781 RepID=A0A9W7SPG8_9PEZI|nr:Two-component system protein B [Teratosphaeria destructans]